ncbi:MAG TPA: adenylate/guanylate cyclase domain-containing protein, partial [Ramlibacter sp.]
MNTGSTRSHDKAVSTGVERRHVTVLFADLSGSSQLAEEIEAELYLELLDEFRHVARTVISRHGGSIARAQGDGVLALFGHPVAREDDGRRATEAALELHARAAQLRAGSGAAATALQMHSGIHAGVLVVSEGDIERGRFDVTGEVANTAFRLCSAAAAGEILVSEATLGPQQDFFSASAPFDMEVRGRTRELRVLRILGRSMVARRFEAVSRRGTIPFIGRAQALQALHAAARRAGLGSSPELLLVMGEPGIGKTRLLQEFERGLPAPEFRVFQGYCESYLGAEPLQPFVQLIRAASNRPAPAPAGGPAGGAPGAKPPNAAELVAALIELITIAQQRTV